MCLHACSPLHAPSANSSLATAEDALAIFAQGAAVQEPHAPLLAAWAKLAAQMGRQQLADDLQRRLLNLQGDGAELQGTAA